MKILLLLLCLFPLEALAQLPRGFFPWWDLPVARDLGLSDDQTRRIQAVLREHRSQLIDLRAAVEKAEGEVADAFNEDTVDSAKATQAINRLVEARANLMRVFSEMSLKLRTVLTAQQWRELLRRRPPQPPTWPPRPGGGPPRPGAPSSPQQPRPPAAPAELE